MGRIIFSVATILVLANFILISSAKTSYDIRTLDDKPIFLTTVVASSSNHQTENLATRFIGDLVIGSRRAGETTVQNTFELTNPTSGVYSKKLYFNSIGIFHYLSISNKEGSFLMACDTPKTLGSRIAEVNVRLAPNSRATYTVFAAVHT